ncbi:DNA-primase RepB domain-containing protein [uncultured Erythrobacter sp.]|uniref:DNA-primase RepB domain-containing protein n=1 Tax=uncultured Erythrobacter sp. TaxID=263913 RepID=UPI00265ADF13|nr:DNA-primase RepB domain-containing protein [uncultured Erythrobacter sp.]
MVPFQYRPLALGRWNHTAVRVATRFLTTLWDYESDAYTFLMTRGAAGWNTHSVNGDRAPEIAEILEQFSPEQHDVYFCPYAFSRPERRKEFALPTKYAHCDIDDADPNGYSPKANILWRTSPGRHQGIWIWNDTAPGLIAEQYSKNLVYRCGGDLGGWSVTKLLRLPGTINHKPDYDNPFVKLVALNSEPQALPPVLSKHVSMKALPEVVSVNLDGVSANDVMRKYRRAVGLSARTLMTAKRMMMADRSKAIFMIISGLVQAKATDSEIAAVLLVNVYFLDKHGPDIDVAEQEIARVRAKLEAGQ